MLDLSDIPEKRRTKAKGWIKIVSGYDQSGLSVKKYCQEQRVHPSTFYYWSNYLNGKTSAPSAIIHKNKRKMTKERKIQKLIPLKVASSPGIINLPTGQDMLCTLHFPNGSFLKVYNTNILPMLFKGLI